MHESSETPTLASLKPKKKSNGLSGFLMIVVIILAVGLGVTGYLYYTTRQELNLLTQPNAQDELAKREVRAIVEKLSKLTLLPDEDPVVATIIDAPFLATQSAFYQKAENGDKLVVYPQAQKAFIFSPGRNIIVNAGPLGLDQTEQTPTGTTTEVEVSPTPSPKPTSAPEITDEIEP